MKNKVALITGASSGIGKELAIYHASLNGDLVLIARRLDLLESLKIELLQKYTVKVELIQADLTSEHACLEIFNRTQELGINVDFLFNNAGFGGHGKFNEREWQKESEMIELNVKALTYLTHLYLPQMIQRGSGKILNTASTAGFMPGPLQAVYFATKAFVVSFSQAVAHENKNNGVTVTALCPGPVATEFEKVAGLEKTNMFNKTASAKKTAIKGYKAMLKGELIVITDSYLNLMIRFIMPLLPNTLILKMVEHIQKVR